MMDGFTTGLGFFGAGAVCFVLAVVGALVAARRL